MLSSTRKVHPEGEGLGMITFPASRGGAFFTGKR